MYPLGWMECWIYVKNIRDLGNNHVKSSRSSKCKHEMSIAWNVVNVVLKLKSVVHIISIFKQSWFTIQSIEHVVMSISILYWIKIFIRMYELMIQSQTLNYENCSTFKHHLFTLAGDPRVPWLFCMWKTSNISLMTLSDKRNWTFFWLLAPSFFYKLGHFAVRDVVKLIYVLM